MDITPAERTARRLRMIADQVRGSADTSARSGQYAELQLIASRIRDIADEIDGPTMSLLEYGIRWDDDNIVSIIGWGGAGAERALTIIEEQRPSRVGHVVVRVHTIGEWEA